MGCLNVREGGGVTPTLPANPFPLALLALQRTVSDPNLPPDPQLDHPGISFGSAIAFSLAFLLLRCQIFNFSQEFLTYF